MPSIETSSTSDSSTSDSSTSDSSAAAGATRTVASSWGVSGMADLRCVRWAGAADVSDTGCQGQHDVPVTQTETAPGEGTRARVERAALDLFTLRGFEHVTTDEVADAAGISRRTFFRYYATKADAVWGDFAGHVARLEALLAGADPDRPVLTSVCAAYVEVNDYADTE